MPTTVTMPQLGESVVEGTIAKWLVAEGDVVQEDQALVEVTTDKIDTEIPSPAAGVVGKILVPEGTTVKIGTVLCEIAPAARPAAPPKAKPSPPAAGAAASGASAAPAEQARAPEHVPSAPAGGIRRPPATEGPAAPETARAGAPSRPAPRSPAHPPSASSAPSGRVSSPAGPPRTRRAREHPGVALDEGRSAAAAERKGGAAQDGRGDGLPPVAAPRLTPLVRKMAAEHGIDLSGIAGTGVGGRITKDDLLGYLGAALRPPPPAAYGDVLGVEAPRPPLPPPPADGGHRVRAVPLSALPPLGSSPPPGAVARPGIELREYVPPAVHPGEDDVVEPFSKRRRIIAEHMVYSKAVSPHVYTMAEVDMAHVASLREARKRAFRESEGVNLTYLPFVVAAAARALREVPRMNATVGEDALILRRDVNIGIAVDTEQGLVVPVLRNVDRLSMRGLARGVEELGAKARARRLVLEDLQGGTFTISNPGREGNLVGFAIINQPQLGILRMGEVKKRPVVVEHDGADAIVVRPIMLLSLSYDHRVIDGVTGNSFLYRVKEHLEQGDFEL